jgi:molybdopterin/thiamine biosynthesis adenylyltransferase/rhodanese-related sulfurtransferase/molybdopterin converting factor small subunit
MNMSVRVLIPTPLRRYAGGQKEVEVKGATVEEVIDQMTRQFTGLRSQLYSEDGKIRNFVNIYLNDQDIRFLSAEKTSLKEGDTLMIVPAVAGGSGLDSREESELSFEEIRRYGRHLIMPEVGMKGQKKLKKARVLVVGAGGLGSPVLLYLAAAGVGTLGVVDFDQVDQSNLQRQILYSTEEVGKSKTETAASKLKALNPNVNVIPHSVQLTSENALEVIKSYDIVLDGTDNFPTRYLVNDACVMLGKPNVYASIFRFEGQVSVFYAKEGPCYRCLYPEPPPPGLVPSCAEGGVLGILPGLVGLIQATEAVKLVLGVGNPLIGRLMLVDALEMSFRELKLRKNPNCAVCGEHPTVTKLIDYKNFCGITEESPEQVLVPSITVKELASRMKNGGKITLIDVREPYEYEICNIKGSKLLPLDELPERVNELDTSEEIVVHCHTGGRSARAVMLLRELGFKKVSNLQGGIDAWSAQVDPSVPRY